MNIIYHHRTQAEDAQGIHISEIIKGFRLDNHHVLEIALVRTDDKNKHAIKNEDDKPQSFLSKLREKLPDFARELLEMSYSFLGFLKLLKDSKDFRADFIYERYALFNAAGIFFAKWKKIPIVIEINSPLALEQQNLGSLTFTKIAFYLETWILNQADHVIAVSTPLKNTLISQGVKSNLITVMFNGVDPDHFHGDASAGTPIREQYNLNNKTVIGFVGWVRKWHGIEEIIKSMATWEGELKNSHVLIIGDGPAREDIESTAKQLNLSDRVHVTGAINHNDIVPYLAAIDIALQPASTPYASPMKILEYLAMGKPVIAINQENTYELLEDHKNALFFDEGDTQGFIAQLTKLLSDEQLLNRMSYKSRQSIFDNHYLWTENAKNVIALLNN